ncbi:MAG: hypothetical protein ACR2HY_10175 [Acidimicrobiales bacterium]
MITGCCPFCGAEYALSEAGCWDCKVSLGEASPPTLATDDSVDEVVYELDDWPVPARVELTTALAERGIPSRWEPGLILAVREIDDEATENVLDALEGSAGNLDEAAGDGAARDEADADVDEGTGEVDSDSAAQAAMADLFVAADRLMHEPDDEVVSAELGLAAGVVDDSEPPYGIEPELWQKVRELATALCGDLDAHAPDEVVAADARLLREVLRAYV